MITSSADTTQPVNFHTVFFSIFILFTIISLLNIPVLVTLWRHGFDDGTYSHAYLIPFITLFLYYKLAELDKLRWRNTLSVVATLFFVGSCALLWVTATAQISVGYWFAFLALVVTSVTMMFRFNGYVVFPAAFLIFIFPFWGFLTAVLQNLSITAVTYLMGFTGVPTYVEATFVTIPAGVFEIAGGCSGLRYLIVSLAISSLFIFLYIKNVKRAALFFSIAVFGALLTNWIRIAALILIGEYTKMESSLMADHNTFGWYLYIPFMFLLFRWGNKLSDHDLFNSKNTVDEPIAAQRPNAVIVSVMALLLVLSSTMLATQTTTQLTSPQPSSELSATNHITLPNILDYSSVQSMINADIPAKVNYLVYQFDGSNLDGKPTAFGNNLIPEGWREIKQTTLNNWQLSYLVKGSEKALVLNKYEINGQTSAQSGQFKLLRLINAIKNISSTKLHWAFTRCESDCALELQQLSTLP